MRIKNYQRLSRIYDLEWGKFSGYYLELLARLLQDIPAKQTNILDLACGTGNLALELAQQGHRVIGLDSSAEMIEIARGKAPSRENPCFVEMDMTNFDLPLSFDLITCTFDSINYLLETAQLSSMFASVASALNSNGLFVFDSNTEVLYREHQGVHERQLGGETLIHRCFYHPGSREALTIFEFAGGVSETHKQRPYDLAELEPLLTTAGLQVASALARFDGTPYDEQSKRLICVARKQTREQD